MIFSDEIQSSQEESSSSRPWTSTSSVTTAPIWRAKRPKQASLRWDLPQRRPSIATSRIFFSRSSRLTSSEAGIISRTSVDLPTFSAIKAKWSCIIQSWFNFERNSICPHQITYQNLIILLSLFNISFFIGLNKLINNGSAPSINLNDYGPPLDIILFQKVQLFYPFLSLSKSNHQLLVISNVFNWFTLIDLREKWYYHYF